MTIIFFVLIIFLLDIWQSLGFRASVNHFNKIIWNWRQGLARLHRLSLALLSSFAFWGRARLLSVLPLFFFMKWWCWWRVRRILKNDFLFRRLGILIRVLILTLIILALSLGVLITILTMLTLRFGLFIISILTNIALTITLGPRGLRRIRDHIIILLRLCLLACHRGNVGSS